MNIRSATPKDAEAIAQLHAHSWQSSYRGSLTDKFLDFHAEENRSKFWAERMHSPISNQEVILLLDQSNLLGFASLYIDEDPIFGTFINNLHVRQDKLRCGLGRLLMSEVRERCVARAPNSKLYLWVVTTNTRALSFYHRLGAQGHSVETWEPPGGGTALIQRMVWNSPLAICVEA